MYVCVYVYVYISLLLLYFLSFLSATYKVLVDLQTTHEKLRTEQHVLQAAIVDYKSQSEDALNKVRHRQEQRKG